MALRAQNSKNNKKAKIMASRTKDNDFSKIRMTDDEREAHKRREEELLRKNLADKVERMKARIEMEEREKLLPKKRKRKSKNGEIVEAPMVDHDDLRNGYNESNNTKSIDNYQPEKEKVRKPKPPPPPVMSFSDLLKIAEKRQVEPVEIVIKKKEEEKLMTKRERKIMEEDMARLRRKQERLLQQKNGLPKPSNSASVSTMNKNNVLGKEENKKPVVIHVKSDQDAKFKIPKSSVNAAPSKVSSSKPKDISPAIIPKSGSNSNSLGKPLKSSPVNEQKKVNRPKDDTRSLIKGEEIKKKIAVPKKNELKSNPVQMVSKKQAPQIDEEALKADIERKVQERLTKEREKLEKEIEEKIAAKFAQFQNMQPKVTEKIPEAPKQIKKEPVVEKKITKKIIEKPQSGSGFFKKDMERMIAMRKESIEKSSLKPKMPEKAFHKNPYLDPPRRLLEPQRPPRK